MRPSTEVSPIIAHAVATLLPHGPFIVPGQWAGMADACLPCLSDDGGGDELPTCCPARDSRSRMRSCSCVSVVRSSRMGALGSAMVACCVATSACSVAKREGIRFQDVEGNPLGAGTVQ